MRLLPRRAGPAGFVAVLLGVALLTGCSSGEDRAAQGLADGLASGSLEQVRFVSAAQAEAAQADLTAARDGMAGLEPAVELVEVKDGPEGSRQAVLAYTWPLRPGRRAADRWTYRTQARLTEGDDGWVVDWDRAVLAPELAADEMLRLRRLQPPRANVLGAGAATLVENRAVTRFGIDRGKVDPAQAAGSARELAVLVGVDPGPYADRVSRAGPRQFVEAITLRDEQAAAAIAGYPRIPGAVAVRDQVPLGPNSVFARPLLGRVGPVTAELIERDPGVYVEGDEVGLSGLQRRYDARLGGRRGAAVLAVKPDGAARTLHEVPATPGEPVATTLDPALQQAAEDALTGVGSAAAVVVVQPSTGRVLAAASGTGGQGYSTATSGAYPPGSTFKVVTALAMLRAGMTPDSQVQCPATITVDGRTFKNYSDFPADRVGTMTLTEAVASSCNTVFLGAADEVGPEQLAQAAASLGVTGWDDTTVGLGSRDGTVPADGSTTEKAAATIGQGKVTATPLAMATMMASVQAGHTVSPVLVTDPAPEPAAAPAQPLTAQEAAQLQTMTAATVTSGTASSLGLPGGTRAKTGTAEFGRATPPQTHAWFVAAEGDRAVAVFVQQGSSGASTAGPIAARVLGG